MNHPHDIPPEGPPLHVKVRAIRQFREHAARTYVNGRHDWRKHCAECAVCGTISAKPPCPEGQRLLNVAAGRETEKEKDSSPAAVVVSGKPRQRSKPRRVGKERKDKVSAL